LSFAEATLRPVEMAFWLLLISLLVLFMVCMATMAPLFVFTLIILDLLTHNDAPFRCIDPSDRREE
jgi:high-affinity K+ transport system ATPase subunit B